MFLSILGLGVLTMFLKSFKKPFMNRLICISTIQSDPKDAILFSIIFGLDIFAGETRLSFGSIFGSSGRFIHVLQGFPFISSADKQSTIGELQLTSSFGLAAVTVMAIKELAIAVPITTVAIAGMGIRSTCYTPYDTTKNKAKPGQVMHVCKCLTVKKRKEI